MAKPKVENIARLHAIVLGTPEGQELLAHWRKTFCDRPCFQTGMTTEDAIHKDGIRYMVLYIHGQVQAGLDKTKAPKKAVTEEE